MMWALVAILALSIPLVAVVLDSKLGRALAARIERDLGPTDQAMDDRVAALESEVDRLGRDVQRLEEESEFLHRLLEAKTASDSPSSGEEH